MGPSRRGALHKCLVALFLFGFTFVSVTDFDNAMEEDCDDDGGKDDGDNVNDNGSSLEYKNLRLLRYSPTMSHEYR
jgi:hypothetical protein